MRVDGGAQRSKRQGVGGDVLGRRRGGRPQPHLLHAARALRVPPPGALRLTVLMLSLTVLMLSLTVLMLSLTVLMLSLTVLMPSLTVLMLSCVYPPGSGAAVLAPFGTPKRAVRAPTHRVFVVCLENLVVDVVRFAFDFNQSANFDLRF
jgi:hypothetical protein